MIIICRDILYDVYKSLKTNTADHVGPVTETLLLRFLPRRLNEVLLDTIEVMFQKEVTA